MGRIWLSGGGGWGRRAIHDDRNTRLLSFSAHKDAAAVHAFAPLAKMLTREQVSFNHSFQKIFFRLKG
jgi:hypothetical protein